ncbi:MAG: glycosyltransferase family 4 protein [Nitrospira sp. CG24A]|nr:MAG: glycosyltransferase family 4 protein [Nitrospira sp. CG24A]
MRWFLFCYWYEPDAPSDPVGLVRLWALARQLSQRGDSVTVFPPRYRSSLLQQGFLIAPIPFLPWPVLRPISYAILSFVVGFMRACWSKPDVVYYRWMDSPHPLLFARLFGAQCICEVNGEPVPPWCASGLRSRMTHTLAAFALRRCDRVVVLTDGLRSLVQSQYGVQPDRVVVLPSGSDTAVFRPRERSACREEEHLDPTCQYIGFVGSFYRYQGLTTLLEAFARIHDRRPSTRLLMIGEGEETAALLELAAQRGLSSWITWVGRVEYTRVPIWIGAMNVCVAPFCGNRGETSPVKIFDYLACGRPVVASAIPSVTELFSRANGVVLVQPDQIDALAEAVLDLLADPEEACRLGRKGRVFVEQRFGWDAIVRTLRDLVRQIVPHDHDRHRLVVNDK